MTAEGTERTGEIRGVNVHWVSHQSRGRRGIGVSVAGVRGLAFTMRAPIEAFAVRRES